MRGIEVAAWGTVISEVELKTAKTGKKYCGINLAVVTGNDEEGKETSQIVRVTAFGENAEIFSKNASKGCRAYFEGTLSLGIWHPENREPRVNASVAAWLLQRTGAIGKHRQRQPRPDTQAPIEPRRTGRAPPEFALETTAGSTLYDWAEHGDALSDLGPSWRQRR